MARPNGKGGWELTDEDVAEVMRVSFGDEHEPCCTACGGAGGTMSGPCPDCYGTGHAHPTDRSDE